MSPIGLAFLFSILMMLALISLLQETPDVEIKLYTKKNPINARNVLQNASNLNDTYFDPSKATVVIVHAFTENFKNICSAVIRDAYLENTDSNVIAVSWLKLSSLYYKNVIRNAKNLAEILSVFLDNLVLKSNRSLIHVIGSSLEAQIVRLAAKNMKNGPLSRIIALEPDEPIFEDKDDAKYLDVDDAKFVMVIHTTGDFSKSIGLADFYPNGGTSPQPGCSGRKAAVRTCSHQMACMYYAESLYNPMAFPARLCNSWLEYKNGKCSDNEQVLMGANTPYSARGSFYLETKAGKPYGNGAKKPEVKDTKQISTTQCTKICSTGTCVENLTIDILFCILSILVCIVLIIIVFMHCKHFKVPILLLRARAASMKNAQTPSSNQQKHDYSLKKINKLNEKIKKGLMLLSDHQTNDKKINLI